MPSLSILLVGVHVKEINIEADKFYLEVTFFFGSISQCLGTSREVSVAW